MSCQQLGFIEVVEVIVNITVESAMESAGNHKVDHRKEVVEDFSNSFVKELGQTNEVGSYDNFGISFDQTLVE